MALVLEAAGDINLALNFAKEAKNQGSLRANEILDCYSLNPVHSNPQDNFNYHQHRSSAHDNSDSACEASIRLALGLGTKQDKEKSLLLCQKSAMDGNPKASFIMARKYFYGIGLPKDYQMAKENLKIAAGKGHTSAIIFMFEHMWKDSDKEIQSLLIQATHDTSSLAPRFSIFLAHHYLKGPSPNPKKAFALMKDAADKQSTLAMYLMSCYYEAGIGTDQNLDLARTYLNVSAELKFSPALRKLAKLYQTKDRLQAFQYLRRAAELGDRLAIRLLPSTLYNLFPADNDVTYKQHLLKIVTNKFSFRDFCTLFEALLPVHPLTRASEEGDSWAFALTSEISPQASTALPAARIFNAALISA